MSRAKAAVPPGAGGGSAAGRPRAKSVRWNLPDGEARGAEGESLRARARVMKRVAKVDRGMFLPQGGAAGGPSASPPGESVLNQIFSASSSACLEVKGKNSLGYIVNRAFMKKNRKMERQIEKLLRENAKLKRTEPGEPACQAGDHAAHLLACLPDAF